MKAVVVGAAGLLGAEVVRTWRTTGDPVEALVRSDLDVTVPDAVRETLGRLAPDVLINCAAYNQVDQAESSPGDAFRVNAWAVRAMARAAAEVGAVFVHYSTDFVFDGRTDRPYIEEEAPNPLGAYGASKLVGEWLAADAPRHYVLRVESLFGGAATRSSVDRMVDAMRSGRTVRAFKDRTVSPSHVTDVARATRRLLVEAAPVGVYHCVNSGWTTWLGIAEAVRDLLGLTSADILATSAAEVAMPAARPQFAALSNEKLRRAGVTMPAWEVALARHVGARQVAP